MVLGRHHDPARTEGLHRRLTNVLADEVVEVSQVEPELELGRIIAVHEVVPVQATDVVELGAVPDELDEVGGMGVEHHFPWLPVHIEKRGDLAVAGGRHLGGPLDHGHAAPAIPHQQSHQAGDRDRLDLHPLRPQPSQIPERQAGRHARERRVVVHEAPGSLVQHEEEQRDDQEEEGLGLEEPLRPRAPARAQRCDQGCREQQVCGPRFQQQTAPGRRIPLGPDQPHDGVSHLEHRVEEEIAHVVRKPRAQQQSEKQTAAHGDDDARIERLRSQPMYDQPDSGQGNQDHGAVIELHEREGE
jgi:hypothetical protein